MSGANIMSKNIAEVLKPVVCVGNHDLNYVLGGILSVKVMEITV